MAIDGALTAGWRQRTRRRDSRQPALQKRVARWRKVDGHGRWIACGLGAFCLTACGPGGTAPTPPAPPPAPVTLQQPTTIDLYPVASTTDGDRLFVMVTAVGSAVVNLPVAFDTGSSGVTLYAPRIFPAGMVDSSGFVFPAGQTSLTYNGITVTSQQGKRMFGGPRGRTQTGNIGYAQVTFGDASGELTTDVMPVFLYYLITDTATGEPQAAPTQSGWFGVNAAPDTILVAGSPEPAGGYPACTPDTTGSCRVVSVLKYLRYADGLDAGFLLSPAPLQSCDITVLGGCNPQPMLTLGLTAALEEGFGAVDLTCPPSGYVGPDAIAGYPVCAATIPNTTVMASGASSGTLTTAVLFDSGTPDMILNTPVGSSFPAAVMPGTAVLVATPSGSAYSFTAGAGPYATVVNQNSTAASVVGIGYFTTNFFFNDFTSSSEGWK